MRFLMSVLIAFVCSLGSAQSVVKPVLDVETPFEVTYQSLKLYPNPVVTNATLEFKLLRTSNVQVNLLNILGAQVRSLVNENRNQGKQVFQFSTDQLERGTYFIRLKIDNEIIKTIRVAVSPS